MIRKMPEWYRVLNLVDLSEAVLEKRCATVKKIVMADDQSLILNCVKLFLDYPISDSVNLITQLTTSFLEEDSLFRLTNNEFELKVLAGAIVAEFIETATVDKVPVALAFRSIIFQRDVSKLINIDIVSIVEEYLVYESIERRALVASPTIAKNAFETTLPDNTVENIAALFNKVNVELSKITSSIRQVRDYGTKNITVLEEESNIHWWIFRGCSNLLDRKIADINYRSTPIIIGKELSDLTRILPGTVNAKQFLIKLLSDNVKNKDKTVTIKDCVNNVEDGVKELIKTDSTNFASDFCPLHLAFNLATKVNDGDGWLQLFEKATNISPNSNVSLIDLATQFYTECLLIKSVNP